MDGFFFPAYQSIPSQLVPAEDLPSANAMTGLSGQLSSLIGPSIGAVCVALLGPASAFAFDGITFMISVLCLLLLHLPASTATPTNESVEEAEKALAERPRGLRGVMADLREGLGYVLSSPWIWVTTLVASVGNIALVSPLVVAMPKLVHDVYGQGVWVLGLILTASGVGSILGTVLVGQVRRLRRRGLVAYSALIVTSLALVVFGLPLPKASAPVVASIADAFVGFGLAAFMIIWTTVLQELVPSDKLGRVMSIDMLGSLCLLPIGYALGGVLTDRIGPASVFIAGGLLNTVLALGALCVPGIRNLE